MLTSSPSAGARAARLILAAGLVALLATFASAQTKSPATPAQPAAKPALTAQAPAATDTGEVTSPRTTLAKMSKRITIELTDQPLEAVINYLKDSTTADIDVLWGEEGGNGMKKDLPITMSVKNMPALDLLERILSKAQTEFSENTWQMTSTGSLECGPKDQLNKTRRIELYDIHDLLLVIPNHYDVPQIDLQGLLQQSQGGGGGGGGGRSPFKDDQQTRQNQEQRKKEMDDHAKEIVDIIVQTVEPSQWTDAGGEAASIRYYQGHLIVNAPDYVHRQINGYKYWPSYTQKVVTGRRYVSLNMDSSIGTVDAIHNFPVTGVAGGGGGGGGQPNGPVLPPG